MRASSARARCDAILGCELLGDHALGYIMRAFLPAILACLALASALSGWLIAAAASGGSSDKDSAPASAPLTAAQKPAAAASPIDNDAPAKHARRTACLKDAKARKLVGARRTAFVKDCMGAS
jgi:hypothetical protein